MIPLQLLAYGRHLYGWWRVIFLIIAQVGVLGLVGCHPAVPPRHADVGPGVIEVTGEWRQVERAVDAALIEGEVAIVGREFEPGRKRFDLRTARGLPGWLVAEKFDAEVPDDVPGPIRLEAYFEPFGDPPRERALMLGIRRRLDQLRGREWAPR